MKKIADKKRKQNVTEYILYFFQMEDIIRAYAFNMDDLETYVVSHYPIPEAEKKETLEWLAGLAEAMKVNGIEKHGHLPEIQQTVDELASLHWELLKTDNQYFEIYRKAKSYVVQSILDVGDRNPGHEIQICLHSIYGQLLSRLHGREIPPAILEANERFGDLLSYLAWVFHHREREKISRN